MSDEKKPVDVSKFRKDDEIATKDGQKFKIRNVYMSTTGIMVVAKPHTAGIADWNIPLSEVAEHKEKGA